MKKGLFILTLLSISLLSFGQKEMIEKAEKAFKYYENGEKYKAVKIFEELIIEYPKSEFYGRNLYNIPTIYQELDSNELAIKWFNKVLDDKTLNDSEKDFSRGIFETNTNYKHYSAMNIGVINYNAGNYREALKYYQLADTKYPYYNSSGTDLKLNKIKIASNISDCYKKLGAVDSSIVVLIPHAITESPGLNNHASEKLIQILKENNKNEEFKVEFENSLKELKKIKRGIKLIVYGIEVKVYPYVDEKLSVDYIKQTDFYKRLN